MQNNNNTSPNVLQKSAVKDETTFDRRRDLFIKENQLFSCVYYGDTKRLEAILQIIKKDGIKNGYLSSSELNQAKYLGVSYITIACRAAILGGIYDSDAYDYSDAFIRKIDEMTDVAEISKCIVESMREITQMIHDANICGTYSPIIRKCTNFIYENLDKKISLSTISKECGLTPSYLSSLFKKETGMTVSDFILDKKMTEACNLLTSGEFSCVDVSNKLGFCSQSYFCKCFKAKFGITPLEFLENPLLHSIKIKIGE